MFEYHHNKQTVWNKVIFPPMDGNKKKGENSILWHVNLYIILFLKQ